MVRFNFIVLVNRGINCAKALDHSLNISAKIISHFISLKVSVAQSKVSALVREVKKIILTFKTFQMGKAFARQCFMQSSFYCSIF